MNCAGPGCNSGMQGVWEPIILLWAQGHSPMTHQPAELRLNDVLVCLDCKRRCRPIHFLDDISWGKIKRAFTLQGKTPPNLKTAQITYFVPESLPLQENMLQ